MLCYLSLSALCYLSLAALCYLSLSAGPQRRVCVCGGVNSLVPDCHYETHWSQTLGNNVWEGGCVSGRGVYTEKGIGAWAQKQDL